MLKFIFKRREYNLWQSFPVVFILSVVLMLFQTAMQNGSHLEVYASQLIHIYVLIGNFVPYFIALSILFMLTGSIAWSFGITAAFTNIFLAINYYKVIFRDIPFKPSDLALGKEAFNIIGNYTLEFSWRLVIAIAFLWIVAAFVIGCVRNVRIGAERRICAALVFAALFGAMYNFYYKNENLYRIANNDADRYYEVDEWNHKGFAYSFISNISLSAYRYTAPKGYSDKTALEILAEYEDAALNADKMPNIIAIMGEAYFDIEMSENAQFYESPNPNFTALKEEAQYGHIVVPGFAGDTSATEFEFLTGASLYLINREKPSAYSTCITRDIYCLPRVLKDLGYDTLAIHPGEPWFYNRQTVYPYMGFDKFISKNDLSKDTEKVNNFVSDSETSDLIIKNYKEHLENNPQKKYFNFTVTIQNHGPYSEYDTWRSSLYIRPDGMSDSLYNIINNYTIGHRDADALLGAVTDYLRTVDEPTVLIFFGDHLPYFDAEYEAYDYLGYNIRCRGNDLDSYHKRFLTPYIIWSNDSARKLAAENGGSTETGDAGDISANFLPVKLLNYIGAGLPRYFAFTNNLMNISEVIGSDYFVVNGNKVNEVSDEIYREYIKYRILQYYNLKKYAK